MSPDCDVSDDAIFFPSAAKRHLSTRRNLTSSESLKDAVTEGRIEANYHSEKPCLVFGWLEFRQVAYDRACQFVTYGESILQVIKTQISFVGA